MNRPKSETQELIKYLNAYGYWVVKENRGLKVLGYPNKSPIAGVNIEKVGSAPGWWGAHITQHMIHKITQHFHVRRTATKPDRKGKSVDYLGDSTMSAIDRAVDELSQELGDVIRCRYIGRYTVRETARELGLTPDIVKKRSNKAYKILMAVI